MQTTHKPLNCALTPNLAHLPQDGFQRATVLVVGDLMLDRYVFGNVTRISPEAPVPILAIAGERTVPGGAANVALNVTGLKANARLAGVIGDDLNARCLIRILENSGVDTSAIVTDLSRPTTSKTRIMCGNHQIVRMDEENSDGLPSAMQQTLSDRIQALLDESHAVILSDYAKGVLGTTLTKTLIRECKSRKVPVFVDPKRTDYTPYTGATLVTPNSTEFADALAVMSLAEYDFHNAGAALRARLNATGLLVTQGHNGMTLFTDECSQHFPALEQEVFDVSGAGDTVIATAATVIAEGFDLLTAVCLSNIAASIVVRRAGTTPINWEDLQAALSTAHSSRTKHSYTRATDANKSTAA